MSCLCRVFAVSIQKVSSYAIYILYGFNGESWQYLYRVYGESFVVPIIQSVSSYAIYIRYRFDVYFFVISTQSLCRIFAVSIQSVSSYAIYILHGVYSEHLRILASSSFSRDIYVDSLSIYIYIYVGPEQGICWFSELFLDFYCGVDCWTLVLEVRFGVYLWNLFYMLVLELVCFCTSVLELIVGPWCWKCVLECIFGIKFTFLFWRAVL